MIRSKNVFRLGVKELWSLVRDPIMLVLIAWAFTVAIYVAAPAMPERRSSQRIGRRRGRITPT